MTTEEMKDKAQDKVEADNPGCKDFRVDKVYDSILDGTLITVKFLNPAGKEDSNQVHFGKTEMRVYRWMGDVMTAISGARERVWFFRFMELAGIGGVIAFMLIVIFSLFLCVLALASPDVRNPIIEVVKSSLTLILGYFFGSQSAGKRAT